jgi:hypothetical protein
MRDGIAEARGTRSEENAMMSRRFVSFALTLALGTAGLPALARAEAAPDPLRASIDRALAAPVPTSAPAAAPVRRNQEAGTVSKGGGGGGGKILLALLGTAISVGATYYIVKQTQKTTDPTPSPSYR